ncbi:SDR family NAD(P)-dependent oxidoreductase [Paraburkholderia sp. RL17-337-BIB-A]
MNSVIGKIAVVTGAAGGVGEQIALALARAGAVVGVADLNLQGVKEVVQQIRKSGGTAVCMAMDVTNENAVNEGIDRVIAQFGALDVLVANAGVQILNPLESNSFSDWRKMQATHVDGAFLTTRAALRHMYRDDRGGVVIYIGSVDAQDTSPLMCAYAAAKHALLGIARVLAKEGAPHNVHAYLVCHGAGDDDVVRHVAPRGGADTSFTTAHEVAQTVLHLANSSTRPLATHSPLDCVK